MKNIIVPVFIILLLVSCSTGSKSTTGEAKISKEKLTASEEDIRNAIEARRYILKFDRMYYGNGAWTDLNPRANFLIIDGRKAIMSSAYIGSYSSALPIHGIRVEGNYEEYEIKRNASKGIYEISLTVERGGDSFDIYLSLGEGGNCTTSVNSLRISNVRYSGKIVPVEEVRLGESGETDSV
ncbi:MAG: DUF4251 domain-containing protein [Bacteroidales bacterium]|jgi:hypothetical protein|nr:DUF4251 domain-containing protein [Bacteroidales bacterium]MCU0408394.1 DUF4251 domain-containing protein [Bacteroidales bacterium]